MTDHKEAIIDMLTKLAKVNMQKRENFKANAYKKAAAQLAVVPKITKLEDINGIPRIGKAIKEKIGHVISGNTELIKDLHMNETEKGVFKAKEVFMNIWGVGSAKAELLVKGGILTIEDLKKAVAENPDILTANQKTGLKYFDDIEKKIPRKEMLKHEDEISLRIDRCLAAIGIKDSEFQFHVSGSYRRGAKQSGDIDVLVSYNPAEMPPKISNDDLLAHIIGCTIDRDCIIKNRPYMAETLTLGNKKFMGICRLKNHRVYRRIDIMVIPPEQYPFALLYFTGSKEHNIKMRKVALEKGYSLNEYGFTKTRDSVPNIPKLSTEREIFEFIGVPYIDPIHR